MPSGLLSKAQRTLPRAAPNKVGRMAAVTRDEQSLPTRRRHSRHLTRSRKAVVPWPQPCSMPHDVMRCAHRYADFSGTWTELVDESSKSKRSGVCAGGIPGK